MSTSAQAYQKFIRQSPRKMRLVADLVRNMKVDMALTQLTLSNKRAAQAVLKVLEQAKANAVNNSQLNPASLLIDQIIIEEGPTYKRWQAVSRGRAHSIMKRTSHIKVVLKGDAQDKKSN